MYTSTPSTLMQGYSRLSFILRYPELVPEAYKSMTKLQKSISRSLRFAITLESMGIVGLQVLSKHNQLKNVEIHISIRDEEEGTIRYQIPYPGGIQYPKSPVEAYLLILSYFSRKIVDQYAGCSMTSTATLERELKELLTVKA